MAEPRESNMNSSSMGFNSGFFWRIEVQHAASIDQAQVLAVRDVFRDVGRLHAARMEHPPLAQSFAITADLIARLLPGVVRSNACTLGLAPLALPSGAMGYLHLSAWPALRAALEKRGIAADGPVQNAAEVRASGASSGPRRNSSLRFRLLFDPALVGPSREPTNVGLPPAPTALELGLPVSEGVTMAGIDYLSTGQSGVRAWSMVLADPADAWDAGGQPPVWIAHREHRMLSKRVAKVLTTALADAVVATRVRDPDAVTADLRLAVCDDAAIIRIGPLAGAVLRRGAYRQFVQQLAAVLTRRGVPSAAVLEPRFLNHSAALTELVPDPAAFVASPDADASITQLVELRQASPVGEDAAILEAECQRLTSAAWAYLSPPTVAWLPEPSSILFGRTPPPTINAELTVYVPTNAALPADGSQRAEEWLNLVLNGGNQGRDRALQELGTSRRIGTVALARALSARHLRRPLPVSRRTNVDAFRLACSQLLAGYGRTASHPELSRSVAEVLLASVRQPKVATELLATVQELLVCAGIRPPVIVVLGALGAKLLPVKIAHPAAVDTAINLVDAGYEEDLEVIWEHNPEGILRPRHLDRALPELLDPAAVGTDRAALTAFAQWALQDAQSRRARGVRGMAAYVTVPEPRLRPRGFERVYFLRETASHVVVLCTSADAGRVVVRLPRTGHPWDGWAATPGGALLAAFLAAAYRDMVVPLDVEPFAEQAPPPTAADPTIGPIRLEPVGYLPVPRRPRRRGTAALMDRLRPAPHQVTWYIRRLVPGQRAHPNALARAAAVGMTVPAGYTFVDTYFWPRATDPRSGATALRATVAVSSLRVLLQADTAQQRNPHANDSSTRARSSNEFDRPANAVQADHETDAPAPSSPIRRQHPWWAFWRRG